jgi:hypothetical protein
MPIERAHSFLVHPAKHEEEPPEISGTQIRRRDPVYKMLTTVFDRASDECDIEIVFQVGDDGVQQNECRDLVVAYAQEPTVTHGRRVAERLQAVTTHRSGLGLLFLMTGQLNDEHKLVISRFPADQGVIAEERAHELSVEFIERVFMKSAKAYKSALYASNSFERGFWDGRAVDRQISGPRELSDYWIRDFLASELRTTGPAGTMRLAVALRNAVSATPDLDIRHELISAAALLRGQHGQRRSARQLVERLGLSQPAAVALEAGFVRPDLMDEVFQFDRDEFQRHAPYRAVELDNGGVMVADDARFPQVFRQEIVDAAAGRMRYVTEGRVVDERLRKNR